MKTALIAGGSGLIGRELINLLLATDRYATVKVMVRSTMNLDHPKLIQVKVDYEKLSEYESQIVSDDVFCCLGTTIANAGTKENFRRVDHDYPLSLAKLTSQLGSKQFMLVSALGANRNSSIFYNQVKGNVEDAISRISFHSIHIFRPSLLLGARAEKRRGEDTAKILYKIFWFLWPKQYRPIEARQVAKAMLHYAARDEAGVFFHESKDLQKI